MFAAVRILLQRVSGISYLVLWEIRTFLRGFSLPVPTAVQVGPFLLRRFEPPWAVECAASLADVERPRHHGRRNVEDRPAGYGRPFRIVNTL